MPLFYRGHSRAMTIVGPKNDDIRDHMPSCSSLPEHAQQQFLFLIMKVKLALVGML